MHTYTLKKFPTAFKLHPEVNSSIKLPTLYSGRLNHMRLDVDTTTPHKQDIRVSDPIEAIFPLLQKMSNSPKPSYSMFSCCLPEARQCL
ncbi:hypothetical protein BDV35DRAFT_374213 [Aspergillus flavus]|uniref:Uncharacterized protein n=1 Tax=Aspergillus flavus TaxID=5059 RepID=A0A5N6GCV7_ASPFL|nr:hypothetical protein BDV35DRAFT_374213 [Aspergillus flavus]